MSHKQLVEVLARQVGELQADLSHLSNERDNLAVLLQRRSEEVGPRYGVNEDEDDHQPYGEAGPADALDQLAARAAERLALQQDQLRDAHEEIARLRGEVTQLQRAQPSFSSASSGEQLPSVSAEDIVDVLVKSRIDWGDPIRDIDVVVLLASCRLSA